MRSIETARWLPALLALVLAGCASFSDDGGFAPVQQAAREQLGAELAWSRTPEDQQRIDRRVAELLTQPLSADTAVQLALINNRGLQADYQELGLAEADLVGAGRLPNPGFSFSRLARGGEVEFDRGWSLNLARVLALPLARQAERRAFERTQSQAAARVLALANDTRRAWVQAVAAAESVRYAQQVLQAAEAGAELARRMAQAGNFSALQQAREQAFYADAATGLARAQQAERSARERLTRLLGLWGDQAGFRLPERLPDLPAAARELLEVERLAIAQRLDVQAARLAVDQTARNLGLTRATRFVDVVELGWQNNGSNREPVQRGWEIGLEVPIFDFGQVKTARAEAIYRQAVHRAAATAIDARSEAREAYGAYRSAWDIARHQRDEVVPLAQRVSEENLLRYNGMLIGVFELLADARAQIAAVNGAIESLRDFWLAEADLQSALTGAPAGSAPAGL